VAAKKKRKPKRVVFYVEIPFDVYTDELPLCSDVAESLNTIIRLDEENPGVKADPWYLLAEDGVAVWKSLGSLVDDRPLDAMGS
jgi:hypothetical protein